MNELLKRAKEIDAEKFAQTEARLADERIAYEFNERLWNVYSKMKRNINNMPSGTDIKLIELAEHLLNIKP